MNTYFLFVQHHIFEVKLLPNRPLTVATVFFSSKVISLKGTKLPPIPCCSLPPQVFQRALLSRSRQRLSSIIHVFWYYVYTHWTWRSGRFSAARGRCIRAAVGNRRSGKSRRGRGPQETRTLHRPCVSRPRTRRPTVSGGPSCPSTCTAGTRDQVLGKAKKMKIMVAMCSVNWEKLNGFNRTIRFFKTV